MANRYRHRTYSRRLFVNYSNWDDEILQRTARAMYRLRWPQKSWFTPFEDLDYHQSSWFLRWALEFLHAAMPDGPQADVWYPEEAGKAYHRMSHERCEYDGFEDERWPQVHNWYEECAAQIFNAGIHGIPVDNTEVLPSYLKNAKRTRL